VKRGHLALVFALAAGLYLPSARHSFVQDDRGIIALNPAVHSVPAALAAFDDPYWPGTSAAGLYRPVTILSLALDWMIGGGRPGWFHIVNALWHGIVTVLVTLVLARWLPPLGAVAAGLVFAAHPVHVEGVASLVARAELLAAAGIFGAVWCARRQWWLGAVAVAALAMFSKEHGVIAGALILADDWLAGREARRYPWPFYGALAAVTVAFLALWWHVGHIESVDRAAAFYGTDPGARLAIAFPAILRAATLLVWPADLSADYGPQVLPVRETFSLAAAGGLLVVGGVIALAVWCRRRAPALSFAAVAALLTYLPTSNLLFASGIVLAERNLYVAVILVAALIGWGAVAFSRRWGERRAAVAAGIIVLALALRTELRLPAWENNRRFLLTTLTEHPESYRAHVWAAAVLSGIGDSTGARREYARAEALFDRDPHLDGSHAYYLMTLGDTAAAVPRIARARASAPRQPLALRALFLLHLARQDRAGARALADTAVGWAPAEAGFYRDRLP
jgi:hypothetical protein